MAKGCQGGVISVGLSRQLYFYTKALLLPINACYLGSSKIKEKRQANLLA
jgi:hypothetical protein